MTPLGRPPHSPIEGRHSRAAAPLVYLLAAGNGTRAGGPKAWRLLDGKGLLERQLEFLLGRFPAGRVAVSIQGEWRRRCEDLHPQVRWTAVAPEASPLGALLELLKASPLSDWGFFYHVDMPVWEGVVFDALEKAIGRAEAGGAQALVPSRQGRKGHPVALSPRLAAELMALDPVHDRLDWWLRTRRIETVEIDHPCIHENLNQ